MIYKMVCDIVDDHFLYLEYIKQIHKMVLNGMSWYNYRKYDYNIYQLPCIPFETEMWSYLNYHLFYSIHLNKTLRPSLSAICYKIK